MALLVPQATAFVVEFFMPDSADHISGKAGLTPTVTISKAGAALGAPAGVVAEIGSGLYKLTGTAVDSDTLGGIWLVAASAGSDGFVGLVAQVAELATVDDIWNDPTAKRIELHAKMHL